MEGIKPSTQEVAVDTKKCPHCQVDIPALATVCMYCTRDIVPDRRPVLIALTLLALPFLACGLFYIAGTWTMNDASSSSSAYCQRWLDYSSRQSSKFADAHELVRYNLDDRATVEAGLAQMRETRDQIAGYVRSGCEDEARQATMEFIDAYIATYRLYLAGNLTAYERELRQAEAAMDRRNELNNALRSQNSP